MRRSILLAIFMLILPVMVSGQLATELTSEVRDRYVTVSAPAYVLRNVTLVDGTGGAVQRGQSVVVEDGRITQVGSNVDIPQNAEILDYSGHTLIPGLFGLHDHMFYTAVGGRAAQLTFSGPRLYLGAGCDDDSHDREPGGVCGDQPQGRDRRRPRARPPYTHHGAVHYGRPGSIPDDASPLPGAGSPVRGVLG